MSNQSTAPALIERVREKHFNTVGPNIASLHYELDPLVRIDSDAIEIKVWRNTRAKPEKEDLAQIERYLQRLNLSEGFLVIFDQRAKPEKWEKRMHSSEAKTETGRQISVFRG